MKLTDKCKIAFKDWFLLNNNHSSLSDRFYEEFLEFPLSMQYGVYEDFFDSAALCVDVIYEYTEILKDCFMWSINDTQVISKSGLTRQEARTEAIKKANEIYNKNYD